MEKKENIKKLVFYAFLFSIVIAVLIILLILHLYIGCIDDYVVVFGTLLFAFPIMSVSFWKARPIDKQRNKKELFFEMILYVFLDVSFFMLFEDYAHLAFIIVGAFLILTLIVYCSKKILRLLKAAKFNIADVLIGFDFLSAVLLSILVIFKIDSGTIQTIAISIVSSLFGGLLTLLGVVITIRDNYYTRKIEEKQRTKPAFGFQLIGKVLKKDPFIERTCFALDNRSKWSAAAFFQLVNSEKNCFKMKKCHHDGEDFNLCGKTIILPSSTCIVSFGFNSEANISIEIEDEFGIYKYTYDLVLIKMKSAYAKKKNLYTIFDMKLRDE